MKKTITILVIALLLGVISYRACVNTRAKRAAMSQKPAEKIVPVRTTLPQKRDIADTIRASGSIQAEIEVMVFSKVNGKIARNLVSMGSTVRPGALLSVIFRDEVGYEFKPYEVTSDLSGVVSRVMLNPGAAVTTATPLMSIVNIDRVKAVVAVDELKIRHVKIGMSARLLVAAYPDEGFAAKVSAISPVCNPQTRAVDVEIRIPNSGFRLKPGMYAEMEMALSRRQALVLPVAAVVERGGQKYVFFLTEQRVKMIPVTTGVVIADSIEIVSGLSGTETVVATGAERLDDGDRVKVVGQ